jgi:hypothetical protein
MIGNGTPSNQSKAPFPKSIAVLLQTGTTLENGESSLGEVVVRFP